MQSRPPLGDFDYHFFAVKVTLLANCIAQDEAALAWARRAADLQPPTHPHAQGSLLSIFIAAHLQVNDWHSALMQARETGRLYVALRSLSGSEDESDLLKPVDTEALLHALPRSAERQVDHYAALQGLLPVVVWLAGLHLRDADEARAVARAIVVFLNEQSQTAFFPELWRSCAAAVDAVWVEAIGAAGLFTVSSSTTSDLIPWDGPEALIPRLICCLGATIQDDVTLQDALLAHVNLAPYLGASGPADQIIYRRLIFPFFQQFWKMRLARSRFRFSLPVLVETELERSQHLPGPDHVGHLLRVIARSLNIRVPDRDGHQGKRTRSMRENWEDASLRDLPRCS
jgi:hypothetical protein